MNEYIISILCIVAINTILALGLNVISGFCGQVSLGHAAFYGVGAYCAAKLSLLGWSFAASLAAATLLTGLFGMFVGIASLRVRHDFLAIVTMGAGFVFLGFVRKQKWLGGELGLTGIAESGLSATGEMVFIITAAVVLVAFCLYLKRSWMGFGFSAIASDEDAARTIAINVPGFKLAAFGLGTAMAGFAGAFYAYYSKAVLPDTFSFVQSVAILTAVVIGGMGSVIGVTIAAVLLTLMPEWFRFINDYRLLVFGGLLIVVMFFSPGGLAGLLEKFTGGRKLA
jgi:branched-chain amino acid transport system permease protein